MADDKNVKTTELIDGVPPDKQELRLLFLVKHPNKVQQITKYLTRRGWPSKTVGSFTELVGLVSEFVPHYVILSINHPSKKILTLPDIIVQTFNSRCIFIGEDMSAKTMQSLDRIKQHKVIKTNISGPSIHRNIIEIIKSEQNLEKANKKKLAQSKKTNKNPIKMEESKQAEVSTNNERVIVEGNVVIKSQSQNLSSSKSNSNEAEEKERGSAFASETSDDSQENAVVGKAENTEDLNLTDKNQDEYEDPFDDGGFFDSMDYDGESEDIKPVIKQATPEDINIENKDKEANSEVLSTANAESANIEGVNGEGAEEYIPLESSKTESRASQIQAENEATEIKSSEQDEPQKIEKLNDIKAESLTEPSVAMKEEVNPEPLDLEKPEDTGDKASEDSVDAVKIAAKTVGSEKISTDVKGLKNANPESETVEDNKILKNLKKAMGNKQTGLFHEIVNESFLKLCDQNSEKLVSLEIVDKTSCLFITSKNNMGYLMIASSGAEVDMELAKSLRVDIEKRLLELNDEYVIETEQVIKIDAVDFSSYASETSEFSIKSRHKGNEVMISFFEMEKIEPKIYEQDKGKLKIELSDFSVNVPCQCSVYMYLEKNEKFYLYLNEGSSLQQKQKEKLIKNNIKHLYIDGEDQEKFKKCSSKFFVINSINTYLQKIIKEEKLKKDVA